MNVPRDRLGLLILPRPWLSSRLNYNTRFITHPCCYLWVVKVAPAHLIFQSPQSIILQLCGQQSESPDHSLNHPLHKDPKKICLKKTVNGSILLIILLVLVLPKQSNKITLKEEGEWEKFMSQSPCALKRARFHVIHVVDDALVFNYWIYFKHFFYYPCISGYHFGCRIFIHLLRYIIHSFEESQCV